MEIHAPTEPIHTKKDFFIHLFTITVGLLIALSLEGLVEYMHHRHLVAEARANIRQEIQDNQKAAKTDMVRLQKNIELQQANIKTITALREHPKGFKGEVMNTMSFDSINDAAWRTARDTGALSFMPYAEVQRYSDLYMLGDLVNKSAISTGQNDFLAAATFDMGMDIDKLPEEEYIRMLHENAVVEIQLYTLRQFVQQFGGLCAEDLKH
jgi:hypothetical protein